MSPSLLLTNALFCCFSIILILPLLRHPNTLTYKKGIPIFIIISAVILKLLIPYELPFTHTLASKNILPTIRNVLNFQIVKDITIGTFLLFIWFIVSLLLLLFMFLNHWRLRKILKIVPASNDIKLNNTLSELCIEKNIKKKPQIIKLDVISSPFIVGIHSPIIVLPTRVSESNIKFVLMHELEHLIHNHMLMKAMIETAVAVYWWNPIVWLLRKELHRALELQADMSVINELTNKESLTYLESLVSISRNVSSNLKTNLSLSFALKNSMIGYRVSTILDSNYFQRKKTVSKFNICLFILSITLLMIPSMITFEAYYPVPESLGENIFTISTDKDYFILGESKDYFILREDKNYDLYINDIYIKTFDFIPEDFSNLPVR